MLGGLSVTLDFHNGLFFGEGFCEHGKSRDRFIVRSLNMILAPFNAMKDALTASLFCKVSQEL